MTSSKEKAIEYLKMNYRAANGATYDALPKPMQDAVLESYLRAQAQEPKVAAPKEINGRNGPEPTRFGDWENKGIISDF